MFKVTTRILNAVDVAKIHLCFYKLKRCCFYLLEVTLLNISRIGVSIYRVRQNYGKQGLMDRYKFHSLSALNLTRD